MRIFANGSLTEITKYPGQHNHEEEVEKVKKEIMLQKLISAVKRDSTKVSKVHENVLEPNPADPCPENLSVKATFHRGRGREVTHVPSSSGTLMITGRRGHELLKAQDFC